MGELQQATVAQLEKELARRRMKIEKLESRREKIAAKLAAVEEELKQLGGSPTQAAGTKKPKAKKAARKKALPAKTPQAGAKKEGPAAAGAQAGKPAKPKRAKKKKVAKRKKRKQPLTESIEKILAEAGQPMDVKGIAEEVKARRLRPKSKNLLALVREGLGRCANVHRVDRGLYALK